MLDESLYFLLKNLREKTLCWEFLESGVTPLFERKLKLLSSFLEVPLYLMDSELPDKMSELMEKFEREKDGIELYMKYGRKPSLTVDGVIMMDGKLVLIRRKNEPFRGKHALPGGFVDYGERTEDAVVREIAEETGLETEVIDIVGVYSDPERDPRGHTVSVVFELKITGGKMLAGDDAADVSLFPLDELPDLAFDHEIIISNYKASINHSG